MKCNTCGIEHLALTVLLVIHRTNIGTLEKKDITSCNDKNVEFLFRQCTIKQDDESSVLVISRIIEALQNAII